MPASATHLRLVYFLYYGSVGTLMPYFGAYLRGMGFSGRTIGTIQMIPSLVAPVAAIGWATWADHHATPSRALRLATGWAAFAVLLLPLAGAPWQFGAVMAALTLGTGAIVPLVDSTTIELCRDR